MRKDAETSETGRARLLERWIAVVGFQDGRSAGADLLARYAQPHRRYHTLRHLTEVLDVVDELADFAEDVDAVRLAAWFHDAIYEINIGGGATGTTSTSTSTSTSISISNEEASARLAESVLAALNVAAGRLSEVSRLVRMTEKHAVEAGDGNGAVLSDADLAILGASPERYEQYAQAVRQEYRAVPEDLFRAGRAAVLRSLLDQPALFQTPAARARYEERARENMRAEMTGRLSA
jgi:predicted metal-dependent HD superfamily phosphohydrolase